MMLTGKDNNVSKRLILAAATAFLLAPTFGAMADFDGDFAPTNWSITEPGPSTPDDVDIPGSIDHDAMSLSIFSPDCSGDNECPAPAYDFAYTTVVQADAYVSFDWEFDTQDTDGPFYDRLGVWRNFEFFQLIDAFIFEGDPGSEGIEAAIVEGGVFYQSGSAGLNVMAGDIFGFGLISDDSCCGASESRIFNFAIGEYGSGIDGPFSPQFVPVPAAAWLFGSALVAMIRFKQRRQ